MEYENNYSSNGKGNLGVTLGAIGTGLGLMAGGLNGLGLFNNNRSCEGDHFVNRYESQQQARIAELETEVKLRDSNIYTDSKILELYKYVDGKLACVENQLCEQRVYNATNTAAISCIQGQVAQLASLTKIVIPAGNLCPSPMPQFNSWTAPVAPTTAG
ncbi:MAG: hypothetical protein U0M60_15285 [Clostridia bacterium]|nr:hypothetical protein [Clostridia bacterium]